MQRRCWILAALVCCACAKPASVSPEMVLPAELEGGWRRGAVTGQPVAEAPEVARQLGLDGVFTASYSGPGEIRTTVYRMRTPETAFELAQKWPPAPASVAIYEKRSLVTIGWSNVDRGALRNFVGALTRHLKSVRE